MSNEHANLNPEAVEMPAGPPDAAVEAEADAPAAATSMVDMSDGIADSAPHTVDVAEAKLALEAVLMAASEPMAVNELKRIFDGELSGDTVRNLLEEMRAEWIGRSVELALVASGYRFRVKPEFQKYLDRLSSEKPPRYSRAVLETLAIIAYRQPVTRGDIEDIRGVQVSPHILKTLQDRGWIDEIGHKEVAGRPALFATTRHFLDDLKLRSLEELPPLH
jgi:segregation and condensation protein B